MKLRRNSCSPETWYENYCTKRIMKTKFKLCLISAPGSAGPTSTGDLSLSFGKGPPRGEILIKLETKRGIRMKVLLQALQRLRARQSPVKVYCNVFKAWPVQLVIRGRTWSGPPRRQSREFKHSTRTVASRFSSLTTKTPTGRNISEENACTVREKIF